MAMTADKVIVLIPRTGRRTEKKPVPKTASGAKPLFYVWVIHISASSSIGEYDFLDNHISFIISTVEAGSQAPQYLSMWQPLPLQLQPRATQNIYLAGETNYILYSENTSMISAINMMSVMSKRMVAY